MHSHRRTFLKWSAAAGASVAAALTDDVVAAQGGTGRPGGQAGAALPPDVPAPIRALRPMTAGIVPIATTERQARIEKARRLMAENQIAAIILEGGSSLFYFTGVRWGLSERPFVAVIPAKGELAWVSPGFEEARARELIEIGGRDLRTWKEAPALDYVTADPITAGCRMIKSPAEIALMQRANDMTIAAYEAGLATLHEGMTQADLRNNILAAYRAIGAQGGAVAVSFGAYTAFPHGSITPQKLKEGDVVQIDDGCNVDGYQSDITRTVVFGKPTRRQIEVWNLEHRAQAAAFEAARPGVPCEAVDTAARKVITDAGFVPATRFRACPTAPATASASTATSGPTSFAGTRRRCSRACASAMSR
jgi:Xaa-Pro dipeptidase